jgi:hypothetical protein
VRIQPEQALLAVLELAVQESGVHHVDSLAGGVVLLSILSA